MVRLNSSTSYLFSFFLEDFRAFLIFLTLLILLLLPGLRPLDFFLAIIKGSVRKCHKHLRNQS